eukprot:CAMPEP_0196598532 /NCGR_PEP_ID=MMETSP1081-20130531/94373_1 /TAXON_ID=36882 /ORGANISM="Pyramimonas amylifera, Strain CCMP720" /LENGTH=53 /DNA_ID=CAMNT_0041924239 /DNA_START=939 /DNA_END=1100 /DNA_ORIENTATION=+
MTDPGAPLDWEPLDGPADGIPEEGDGEMGDEAEVNCDRSESLRSVCCSRGVKS